MRTEFQYVIDAFKDIGRIVSDRNVATSLPIDVLSVNYLVEVGFPAKPMFGFDFGPCRELQEARTIPGSAGVLQKVAWAGDARCIAENYGLMFVLDVHRSGQVFWIDLQGTYAPMFVNSSVHAMGVSLAHYCRVASLRHQLDTADYAGRLRDMIAESDARAISDPSGWWLTVIEEMGYGLL